MRSWMEFGTMTRGVVIVVGLVVFALASYILMLADYRTERCPYTAMDGGSGYHLRVCYRGAYKWIPSLEGFDAFVELRDASGGLIERRLAAENADQPADIAFRFSNVRWDDAQSAFVDNAGRPLLTPSREKK